jgi:hypothetical protein
MAILPLMSTLAIIPAIAIAGNLLRQVFLKDPKVPPEVWHWLPLLGSTVEYGMDPYKFFFRCRAQVRSPYPHFFIHVGLFQQDFNSCLP